MMVRSSGFRFKCFLLLFALNTIPLCLYLFYLYNDVSGISLPFPTKNHLPLKENSHQNTSLKRWPFLPSFLPWSYNPNLPAKSCEGYFGNGFSQRVDLVRRSQGSGRSKLPGWFRCSYSKTLESSVCEGGRLRMNPERIRMSAGGERLEDVIGRAEEEELPSFDPGAFEIEGYPEGDDSQSSRVVRDGFLDQFVPRGAVNLHTMRALFASMRFVPPDEFRCSQWIEDPALIVTRFEYANLFHTITDWYSAYVASRVAGLPSRPHLVFVDGHCKTQLEETWEALFSSLRYAQNFNGSVCFRHVVFSPLGYETALFKGLTESISCTGVPADELKKNRDNGKTARLSEFGEMLRAVLGLPVYERQVSTPLSGYNVLFVRREDYLAHPRHDGRVQSRLSNEQEVFDALKSWVAGHTKCKVNLVNGLFAHFPMKEQVKAIEEASVIIGAHGAGLTHIVAASLKAVILEIISSQYRRPHFMLISQWRGLEYHVINLAGSDADPNEVINKLSDIMKNLGC